MLIFQVVLDNKIILIGYSGHGFVLVDIAIQNNCNIVGYTEKSPVNKNPFELIYLGNENDESFKLWDKNFDYLIGIGDNLLREKIYKLVSKKNKKVRTIVCPSANISKKVIIGQGTFINKNVSININASIGENVILNTSCIIEHECVISNSAHVAPGAVLAGNVHIGERSFIGANSVIKHGVRIGNDVIVGAGSVILRDVPNGCKIVGNPSRII